jgi:hypothetical protein
LAVVGERAAAQGGDTHDGGGENGQDALHCGDLHGGFLTVVKGTVVKGDGQDG